MFATSTVESAWAAELAQSASLGRDIHCWRRGAIRCIFSLDFVTLLYTRAKWSKLSHFLQLEVQDGQGESQLHLVESALKPPAGGEFAGIQNEKFFLKGIESLDIFF